MFILICCYVLNSSKLMTSFTLDSPNLYFNCLKNELLTSTKYLKKKKENHGAGGTVEKSMGLVLVYLFIYFLFFVVRFISNF